MLELSKEQQAILVAVRQGHTIFFTGSAGTLRICDSPGD